MSDHDGGAGNELLDTEVDMDDEMDGMMEGDMFEGEDVHNINLSCGGDTDEGRRHEADEV